MNKFEPISTHHDQMSLVGVPGLMSGGGWLGEAVQIGACKNITFLQFRFWAVINGV